MALTYVKSSGIDVTGNYTVNNLTATANVSANYFTGNGSFLTGIVATTAQTVTTNAQPNITSTGTLTSLTVSGLVTATAGGIKVGNLQDTSGTNTVQLTNSNMLVTGNITAGAGGTGNVTATYFTGTLTTAAQPNITSVGTLSSVSVTANVGAGNILTNNLLYANGSPWSFGSSSYSNASVAEYLPTYTGLIGGTLSTAAQPNITSVGTLANLTVSGIITSTNSTEVRTAPTISAGSLTINLNTASVFDVSLNSNITTLTLSNVQASGYTSSFVLILTADGTARTVVWPDSFKWPSGTAPTITSTSGKKDVFVFFTVDGGTSWQAFISGQNL